MTDVVVIKHDHKFYFQVFLTKDIYSKWINDETLEIYYKRDKTLLLNLVRNPKEVVISLKLLILLLCFVINFIVI